jgi:hypothetical protein
MSEPTPQQKGYLDGWLGLPIESSDDEYLLGYVHGEEARARKD